MEKEILIQLQEGLDGAYLSGLSFLSNYASAVTAAVAAVMLLRIFAARKGSKYEIYLLGLSLLFSAALTHLIKWLVQRPRPYRVFTEIDAYAHGGGYSFPSGHTAEAFTLAFVIWILYKNPVLRALALLWAITVAYSRMALGVHYPTDILGGIVTALISVGLAHAILKKLYSA